MLALIDTEALGRVIASALIAGIGTMVVFSLVILGAARSAEHRRDGSRTTAGAYAVLAGVAFAGFVLAVVFGLQEMASK